MKHTLKKINLINKTFTKFLDLNYSKEKGEVRQKYLKTDFECYGVTVWMVRSEIKHLIKNEEIDLDTAIELSRFWWSKKVVELRLAAIFLMSNYVHMLNKSHFNFIEQMIFSSTGWWEIDVLAIDVVGSLIVNNPTILLHLPIWIESPNFLVRRAAIICQIKEFRQGKGNLKLFKDLILHQLSQPNKGNNMENFFIEKAIGWSLRELSKKQPEEVIKILNLKNILLPKLTFKEASRRLPQSYLQQLKSKSYLKGT